MSHFTTVKTTIKDLAALKRACESLGLEVQGGAGGERFEILGYRGAKTEVNMAVSFGHPRHDGYKVGLVQTEVGVRMVADWWGLRVSQQSFLDAVMAPYAREVVMDQITAGGMVLQSENKTATGEIHLTVGAY